ncbi:MAG: DUF4153 domain-containing protein [Patescibacteria group bacterium]|nr:DUF4153 domain-containing protein [Patescibacteria group bacterium]
MPTNQPQETPEANKWEEAAKLETLFRQNPKEFTAAYATLVKTQPGSPLVKYWEIRLAYDRPAGLQTSAVSGPYGWALGWLVLLLAIFAGTIAKLPDFLQLAQPENFYLRNAGLIIFPALAVYFAMTRPVDRRTLAIAGGVFVVSAVYVNLLPDVPRSDTLMLTYLHLPLLLWTVAGLAFTGRWSAGAAARVEYLKFNGEYAIYAGVLMSAGVMLTVLTIGLFSAIQIDIATWYEHWVVIYGAAAVPIVGAHLAWVRSRSAARILPVIAKIFSPLVLVTLVAYLVIMGVNGKSPYTDREFLIIFNVMMLAVLTISILALTERQRRTIHDLVTLGLLVVGLAVDVVGLSAILFRLGSYGFTPNRIAVLGANLLIFGNAAGLLRCFLKDWRRNAELTATYRWISGYLPVYAVWTAFITFIFPFLFRFR